MRLATKIEPNVEKLDILKDVGFKCLEVYTNYHIIENTGNISLLNQYDFLYAVHSPVDFFDETVIDFAHRINAKIINTHKIVSNERFLDLVSYAQARGIEIAVENDSFPSGHQIDDNGKLYSSLDIYDPLCSGGDFWRLQQQVPGIGLCLDIEHAMIRHEFPIFLDFCWPMLRHVHLCGYTGKEHHQPIYNNMELVKTTAEILKQHNYNGFIVAENNTKYHTQEVWVKTLETCLSLFETDTNMEAN